MLSLWTLETPLPCLATMSGSMGVQAQMVNIGGPVRQARQDSPKRSGHAYLC